MFIHLGALDSWSTCCWQVKSSLAVLSLAVSRTSHQWTTVVCTRFSKQSISPSPKLESRSTNLHAVHLALPHPLFPAMADPAVEPAPATSSENAPAPDEDCSKEYEPVVRLAEVETKTGEENEDVLFKIRAKLFRFSKDRKEWKERGTGDVRILKHKDNKKIRLLMRREKTLKICLNHYVSPVSELQENIGSDRSWVWHSVDYADGERDEALLAIRFRDSTNANAFKEAYDKARAYMADVNAGKEPQEETSAEPEKEETPAGQEEATKEEAKEEKDDKTTS